MRKWKTDYDRLYNGDNTLNEFDIRHLNDVKISIKDPHSNVFPKPDCSSLNGPISYDEVHAAVYRAKLRKATGIDNISSEILRNECCIDLLFKIISYCFEHGCIPSEWARGVIKPLSKGDDPRNPLNYRPITLISIPCKIYANILNARLVKFLEKGNILSDAQNGFRRDRSCQDHVYSLYSIINNRKLKRRDTFACFVDMKKAFDTVNRDCLWFKLLKAGIHGKMVNALQSLYKDVSCAVSINDNLTEWFPVQQGVKQGCGLSPTLFAIYINDLADDINELNCGIDVGDTHISSFLYADDIVLLAECAEDMQRMLNILHLWCRRWRLAVNESKTKVVHFRNRNKPQCDFLFSCGNKSVEYSDCYKYLGFWLNEFLDMDKSINEVTKSASRALGAVYMKYQSAGGMTYDVYKKLIESIVEPVLFYCSGIWGNRKFPKVESVMNKACRLFLGVSKNAPNLSSKGDMGWISAENKQKLETVRLWCRLRNMPEQRTIRKIHNWSFSIGKSWENNMLKFIESLGIQEHMLVPSPSKYMCMKLAREKLIATEKLNWENQLLSDGNSENGNKLRTYRTYKNIFETESYVKLNLRRDHRRILAKFRGCNLPLAIETGR
ncbi:MAG: reverse transcriptase family protein, partial [Candidatus Thiodiazotropha endolucinida]|nr:reverse transcriptase family protein [Candidatus Thiodiazotropha taylori]MCW4342796.1 reverse transcriptase family protein [Candidatus Thiodiazotropha endolucinida]